MFKNADIPGSTSAISPHPMGKETFLQLTHNVRGTLHRDSSHNRRITSEPEGVILNTREYDGQ